MNEIGTLREEICRLSLDYLRGILAEDGGKYGGYTEENGEFRFRATEGVLLPADRVSEWNAGRTGGGKVKFFDKASAIALAKAIGVFDRTPQGETEDLSEEALFGTAAEDG